MYFATDCMTINSNRAASECIIKRAGRGQTRSAWVVIIMRFAPVRFSLKVSSQGLSEIYSALAFET